MTIDQQEAPAPAETRRPADFRPDIQALRAVAVALVVVYHLWPHRLTGGYVGVDVFFVISGYLITSHLWREAATTGGIRLGRFWARRARRLLPSALLVLLVTALGSWLLAPVTQVRGFLSEVAAATLYAENWFLALAAVDYQAIGHAASPVQHYWSLSVEEQFYVLLPVLLVAALGVAARLSWSRRGVVVGVVGAVGAGSFVYSWWLTGWSAGAYFSTFTRLWEFVLGAAVAVAMRRSRSHPGAVLAGLVLMIGAALLFDDATPFPGWHAAVPVIGTAMVLAWGDRTFLSRVGAWRPVAHVGRTSYAIYLWHWPLIVLVPFALGRELGLVDKLAIGVATLLLAAASTAWIEDPVRFSPRLLGGRAPWVVAAWSVAGMAVVLGAVAAGVAATDREVQREREIAASLEAELGGCLGASAADDCDPGADPGAGAVPAATPQAPDEAVEAEQFLPPLADLEDDDANRDECWSGLTSAEFHLCTLGQAEDPVRRILVLGDSHANALIPAFDAVGHERGWAFDLAGHAGCPFTEQPAHTDRGEVREACDAWRVDAFALAADAGRYDAVVVTQQVLRMGDDAREAAAEGLLGAWSRVPTGVPIIAIRDNPRMPDDFVGCLEQAGPAEAATCAAPREETLREDPQLIAAARDPRATAIDLTGVYCDAETCAPVIGAVVAYRPDGHHVTATFAATLAPRLGEEIAAVLAR